MQLTEAPAKNVTIHIGEPGELEDAISSQLAADPRWQLACRIVASGSLGRSRLLAQFLFYIVSRTIEGRTDEITEQQIGVSIFGRSEGYDSHDDNIVRNYARNLRRRLEEYFANEGSSETLCLEVPRGGYVPFFSPRYGTRESPEGSYFAVEPVEPNVDACLEPAEQHLPEPVVNSATAKRHWAGFLARYTLSLALAMLSIGLLLGLYGSGLVSKHALNHWRESRAESASCLLWRQLFSSKRDTFMVPSDDGLVIAQKSIRRPLALSDYVSGTYRTELSGESSPESAEILKLSAKRYTAVADLDIVAHLAQVNQFAPERLMIRFARDIRMDDLRNGNAILIGSDEANPWIDLFNANLPFSFQYRDQLHRPVILNVHPHAGEQSFYLNNGTSTTYGVIAFVPNLDANGYVLIIGGLNMAGTQAAGSFLLDAAKMESTLQRANSGKGTLQPFELLIEAGNVASNASNAHTVLERIGLQEFRPPQP